MSYHDTNYITPSSAKQSATNAQGQIAPTGSHFMPDGTLMSDAEHYRLYAIEKTIFGIDIDFKDIKEAGETRRFTITGDNDAVFSLEMTNEDSPKKYYNFQTHAFQTTRTRLSNKTIEEGSYTGIIKFPIVTDADQYNFHLFAESDYNTKHRDYVQANFSDRTVDINSSSGSRSNLVQKVIYQTLDTAITLSNLSPTGAIASISNTTQVIAASRSKNVIKTPFEIKATFSSGAISIDRQPTALDITTLVSRTIGAAPINIPGEDIYPAITTAANDDSEGGTTVNGSSTGQTVTTHVVSSTIATLGDRVLGNAALAAAETPVTVTAISGGSGKTFTISESISIADDLPLTFSNQRNYRWPIDNIDKLQIGMTTVSTTFSSGSATLQNYIDQITVFEGEANEYKVDNVIVPAFDTLGAKPSITRNATTNVVATVQTGDIVFSDQALLTMAGDTLRIHGYGTDEINNLTGYDVEFSDLRVAINKISTTTTAAVSSNTTIPITSKVGIAAKTTQTVNGATRDSKIVILDSVDGLGIGQSLYAGTGLVGTPTIAIINETTKAITLSTPQTFADGITLTFPNSIISGIGIASGAVDPYVASIASLNLTASVAQTLEDAQTFTFAGAGNIATITGNITVNNVGNDAITLHFDLDKFLTQHSN